MKNEVELSNAIVTSSVAHHLFSAKDDDPNNFFGVHNITDGMDADMEISSDLGQWITSLVSRNVQSLTIGASSDSENASDIRHLTTDMNSEPISASELKSWLFENKFDHQSANGGNQTVISGAASVPLGCNGGARERTCDPLWGSGDTTQQVKHITTTEPNCSSPDSFSGSEDSVLFNCVLVQQQQQDCKSGERQQLAQQTSTASADSISSSDDLITLQPLQPLQPHTATPVLNSLVSDEVIGGYVSPDVKCTAVDEVDLDKMVQDYLYDHEDVSPSVVQSSTIVSEKTSADLTDIVLSNGQQLHVQQQVNQQRQQNTQVSGRAPSMQDIAEGTTIIGAGGTPIRISGLSLQSMVPLQSPTSLTSRTSELAASPVVREVNDLEWASRAVTAPDTSSILESALRGTLISQQPRHLSSTGGVRSGVSATGMSVASPHAELRRHSCDNDLKPLQLPFPVDAFQNLSHSNRRQHSERGGIAGNASATPAISCSTTFALCDVNQPTSSSSPVRQLDGVVSPGDAGCYNTAMTTATEAVVSSACRLADDSEKQCDNAAGCRDSMCLTAKKDSTRKRKYAKRCSPENGELAPSRGRLLHFCPICNKGFKDKYSVNVHIRTHTGEKPFQCELCSKCFRQKAHLAKHVQIHNSIKPAGSQIKV